MFLTLTQSSKAPKRGWLMMSEVDQKLHLANHVLAQKYLNLFLPDSIIREACQLHDREISIA